MEENIASSTAGESQCVRVTNTKYDIIQYIQYNQYLMYVMYVSNVKLDQTMCDCIVCGHES